MSSENGTLINETAQTSRSIIITLQLVKENFVNYLPLVFTIFGIIGFIGNVFTFLQPNLRSNTCAIYSLCGSLIDVINLFVNLLPNYLDISTSNLASSITSVPLCRLKLLVLVFLPQLPMNLLILTSLDRYAGTCGLTSPMRHIRQLKMVPYLIFITTIISCVMSLYSPILYDVVPGSGCICINPLLDSIMYVIIHGLATPFVMLLLVLLTYRNIRRSRQRVGVVENGNGGRHRNPFIGMIFTQVFATSFFTLQWMGVYVYFTITQYNMKSNEQWAIDLFALSLTNDVYFLLSVKSFYLSTLTSGLFRKTFIDGLLKLVHKHPRRQDFSNTTLSLNVMRSKRPGQP